MQYMIVLLTLARAHYRNLATYLLQTKCCVFGRCGSKHTYDFAMIALLVTERLKDKFHLQQSD